MSRRRVLVGLSGGVDSAAVAKLLMDEGYEVYGVYLRFCADSDPTRAREVARCLGIPFRVADRRRRFRREVVEPFVASYEAGKTPNPCVECNRKMKIRCLLEEADRMGIEFVATGHYASVKKKEDGSFGLYSGKDEKKDQSYFLWRLTQRQLSRLIFPLAGRKKEEIRLLAEPYVSRSQKESMEICFIPKGDTQAFLEQRVEEALEGDFVDREGRILGQHRGIFRYTVGQRRGLGVAMGERYFVTRLLPETGRIELGPEAELYTDRIPVEALRGLSGRLRDLPEELLFRGRHRGKRIPCRLVRRGRRGTVYLSEPIRRIAPGQSACFYIGEELVCGGVISEEKGPKSC